MGDTTQLNKFRQKRLKRVTKKASLSEDNQVSTYFYPKQNLYTKQEFELLDSIYSDEAPMVSIKTPRDRKEISEADNFWPQSREEILKISSGKGNLFEKLKWFFVGMMSTSAVWLIFFQLNVHEIKTKSDTQIVFQKHAQIVTDKTVDSELAKKLTGDRQTNPTNQLTSKQEKATFWDIFKKPKKEGAIVQTAQAKPEAKYHVIGNGDSLWLIANKYYSNPSQENIDKIMKANNIRRVGLLKIGQKLVIPS